MNKPRTLSELIDTPPKKLPVDDVIRLNYSTAHIWYFYKDNILYMLRVDEHCGMFMYTHQWSTETRSWVGSHRDIERDQRVIGELFPNQVMESLL